MQDSPLQGTKARTRTSRKKGESELSKAATSVVPAYIKSDSFVEIVTRVPAKVPVKVCITVPVVL